MKKQNIAYHVIVTDMEENENPSRRGITLVAYSDDGKVSTLRTYPIASFLLLRRDLKAIFETFGVPPYNPPRELTFELLSRYYALGDQGRWITDLQPLLSTELSRSHRVSLVQACVCPDHVLHYRMDITTKVGLRNGRSSFNLRFAAMLDDIAQCTAQMQERLSYMCRSKDTRRRLSSSPDETTNR